MMNVPIPSFTEEDLQSAKERRAILDALYALSEQLQRNLNNLDESAFSSDFVARIEKIRQQAAVAEETAGALREQTITVRNALKQEIIASATEITTDYTAAIQASQEQASSLYVKETAYVSELGRLEEELRSLVTQTANALSIEFTNTISTELAQLNDLVTRFTFDESGMSINRNTSLTYMLLDNDSITFQQDVTGGTKVLAELSADGLITYRITATDLSVDTATAAKSMTVGRFRWVDEGANGFSLVRI